MQTSLSERLANQLRQKRQVAAQETRPGLGGRGGHQKEARAPGQEPSAGQGAHGRSPAALGAFEALGVAA